MDDRHFLSLHVRPGTRALASVVSVLHSRGADVVALSYAQESVTGRLFVQCTGERSRAEQLVRQLERRVDVLGVSLQTTPSPPRAQPASPSSSASSRSA